MANKIKMRTVAESNSVCEICGATRANSLDMFDIAFDRTDGRIVIRLCDLCNEELFNKTLKATCNINGRVKSQQDMAVIHKRHTSVYSYSSTLKNESQTKEELRSINDTLRGMNLPGDEDL